MAVAARDLQQEYVQLLPRVTARYGVGNLGDLAGLMLLCTARPVASVCGCIASIAWACLSLWMVAIRGAECCMSMTDMYQFALCISSRSEREAEAEVEVEIQVQSPVIVDALMSCLCCVCYRFTEFLSSGGDRDPDALQSLFTSLSLICKVLAKHLCAQLPTVLKLTTGMSSAV